MDRKEIDNNIKGYKKKINKLIEQKFDLQDESLQNLSKELDEYIAIYYGVEDKKDKNSDYKRI